MARAHGTRSMYVTGCRCVDCTAAHRDYERVASNHRRHPKIYGKRRVDAAPYVKLVETITLPIVNLRDLADEAGLSASTVSDLLNGKRQYLRVVTAEKLRVAILKHLPEGTNGDAPAQT